MIKNERRCGIRKRWKMIEKEEKKEQKERKARERKKKRSNIVAY